MSNEIPKEFSSFMTPDSLRKTSQMLNSFYDNHTKKNYGYEDINGSQYSGVVENFGSELLLESRKILMDTPSLKNVFVDNTFDFYFNIQYSDLIDTYDQQSLLVAILSKDVLLSNKEYRIRFDNCSTKHVLRAESWSDPIVRRDMFIHTNTPPTLVITDINDPSNVEEITLKLSDETDISTDYYFFKNITTQYFIEEYDQVNGILTTIPLTDKMAEQPFVWMCVDIFRLLPDINFVNNKDEDNNPLLTIGTDGHAVTRLYPYVYGIDNIPDKSMMSNWFIKVHAANNESFVNSMNSTNNYSTAIGKISFINCRTIGKQPNHEHVITFDQTYVKMTLSRDVEWSFRSPRGGDYDYDGTTYNNPCYAYIKLDEFNDNIHLFDGQRTDLTSAFIVRFDDSYLHEFESMCNNAISGIHIDASSEYSVNSVDKKNGVIHDLGDFDGLPKYFSYLLNRTIHRIHTELYSIRDDLNNRNQHAIDKQTAALILDSAIPQNEVSYVTENLNTVITYDANRTYITTDESVSPKNSLSEITFVDENTFGHIDLPRNKYLNRFVYHGNRVFSIGMMGFDPELEVARVYYVNNDTTDYENNELTKFKKSSRCLCRICDIPTSFVQLINIKGLAPTLVIDEKYVRTEVPFSNDDNEELWNDKNPRLVTREYIDSSKTMRTIIFNHDVELNEVIGAGYLSNNYYTTKNLNRSMNLFDSDYCSMTILNNGEGYAVGDEFKLIIGGICFKCDITEVEESDGSVTAFRYTAETVNISNIDGPEMVLKTTTISGNGHGLTLKLHIDTDYWDSLQPYRGDILSDLYAFKFDKFGNIWVWEYNNETNIWLQSYQLTGTPIIENEYDDISTQEERRMIDVFVKNTLITNNVIEDSAWMSEVSDHSCLDIRIMTSTISSEMNVSSTTDQSEWIKGINKQDRYYIPIENPSGVAQYHDVICIDRYDPIWNGEYVYEHLFPRFHQMNLSSYHSKANALSYTYSDVDYNSQPVMSYYNPFATDIYQFEKVTNDVYEISNKRELTFADILLTRTDDGITNGILDKETGVLSRNVYTYNEYRMSSDLVKLLNKLKTLTREELIEYIKEHLSPDVYPLQFEETEYSYTEQMLIDYIMENSYVSPVYKKDGIYLLREKGQQVVEPVNDSYIGIGEQPKGLYLPISTTNIKTNTYVDGKSISSESMFIFRIDCNPGEFGSLDDYVITDDLGNDITEKSILIYNNSMYVYKKNSGWVLLSQ